MRKQSIALAMFAWFALAVFGQSADDFEFTVNGSGNDRTVTITGYKQTGKRAGTYRLTNGRWR
jgi:hypothetical protein